ncbi:MAG: helix-turn-helix domain-containing protein [Rhizobiales bacterium]|nr:helix-turn-helix domain-containing protein [Hyphomicrobiales bacterium]
METIKLTPLEQLYYDALKSGALVKEDQLAAIQPPPPKRLSNVVATHIKDMRKKGIKIRNVRGEGYQLIHALRSQVRAL